MATGTGVAAILWLTFRPVVHPNLIIVIGTVTIMLVGFALIALPKR
jgi:hypothetical protein